MARRRLNANHVPVPDPDLTPRAMAERAAAMRPALRQRQAATEAARRILGETNDEFVRAGFYRILQPRRFGGYEFDLPTFVRVAMEVSRGCPSSGWVVTFTAGHTHVFAKFPEQAQAEAYGSDGEFRAPFVGNALNPSVQEVDGGYRVSGAWDYASGCDTATHFFGAVFLPLAQPAGPSGGSLLFLFDRADFEIIDNWEMLGMRGTGSKRVRVKDVFVPAHRVNRRDWLERSDEPDILRPFDRAQGRQAQDAAPGYGLFANPMYAGPSGNVLMAEIAAVAVGTGFCALDAYEEILKTRVLRGPSGTSRAESPEYQRNYGHAHALLATAGAALIGCAEEYMEACRLEVEEGVRFDSEKSQHLTLIEQQVTRLAGEAVDILIRSAGSSASRPGSMLERCFRDMVTLRTHTTLQLDRYFEGFGRVHFGLGPGSPFAAAPAAAERTTFDALP